MSYLDNKYISIDEHTSLFRKFVNEKKITSWNWVCVRGPDLGSIAFFPMPDRFFQENLNKHQLDQFTILQQKLKNVKNTEEEFRFPIISDNDLIYNLPLQQADPLPSREDPLK